jgi:hypothetical protein
MSTPFHVPMEPRESSNAPGRGGVIDCATLYLCRQAETWVVVIESVRITGTLRLSHSGRDSYGARFALLVRARRACPDATIIGTDGVLEGADYEWRLEVRNVEAHMGDLGLVLLRELSESETSPNAQRWNHRPRLRCCRGRRHGVAGRPRLF